jgi:antitoxin HicB
MGASHRYSVILEPLEEGGFNVRVPALPEVVTYGGSEAEALAMAEDAIRLALSYRLDHGEPVPPEAKPKLREVTVAL